ncbi:xanthine dehydrogenase family protein molybdopterin-binding subunit [Stygiolobus caldivivus]|uniref:Xanthine dehydrogenase n=1 Tax=Stygiolobus caldivivus TaxID=2824673 RepID=A0A8D5U8Y9_9CREN|nr:xanthine dehydrogenase family protein molybdopterin-binding subunit [Stygiolobus caldivivus]BCU70926.1 xanthine dehydrogenase [Stygiolobus caldivivus]
MYIEGERAVKGEGMYISDLPDLPGTLNMAIFRSPIAHGIIRKIDVKDVIDHGGIALTPEELSKVIINPFPVTVDKKVAYYPFARGKVRFVGEPIVLVLAKDYYKAIDLLDYVQVELEELKPVVSIEDALKGEPLVHEEIGTNVVMDKHFSFGDPNIFSKAEVVISHPFKFSRHSSMPLEPYGVLAYFRDELTVWSNIQGPMLQAYFITKALNIPVTKLKLKSPRDIGGSFGIKYEVYPYITLAAAASKLLNVPVRWNESKTEHFIASSAGAERKGEVEIAANRDGKILGIRYNFIEDVGAYVRPPEPGALFRVQGCLNGAYDIKNISGWYRVVVTNKSPTGLNRGYGAPSFFFALETAVDHLADELGIDPFELRLKNLITRFDNVIDGVEFYETPGGGLYPKQDYVKVVMSIKEEYEKWKNRGDAGVGLAVFVEPSVTNLAYVDLALDNRKNPHSASADYITLSFNPDGTLSVFINGTNEGLGHETTIVDIVCRELGLRPEEVNVTNQVDTDQPWNLASGSYSSRFAPVVVSALMRAIEDLKEKLTTLAKKYLESEDVVLKGGKFVDPKDPRKSVDIRRLVSAYHWNPSAFNVNFPLASTGYYYSPLLRPVEGNRINSALGYGINAHLAVVKMSEGQIKVIKYVVAHDIGKILEKDILEGIMTGSIVHGINMALYEELKYDERGNPIVTTLDSYESLTLGDLVGTEIEFIHFETPSPYIPSGAYGGGEGPIMGAPAAIANAVSRLVKKRISETPIRVI